jgi:hypothetical protein
MIVLNLHDQNLNALIGFLQGSSKQPYDQMVIIYLSNMVVIPTLGVTEKFMGD